MSPLLIWMLVATIALVAVALWFGRKPSKPLPKPNVDQAFVGKSTVEVSTQSYTEANNAAPNGYIDNYYIKLEPVERRVSAYLWLRYQKTNGEVTPRDFDVTSFQRGVGDDAQHCWFSGRCHTRKAYRTLSSKGVLECVDRETGEIIRDVAAFLNAKYAASPEKVQDDILAEHWPALEILRYVAAADGRMMAPERQIILEFIREHDPAGALDGGALDKLVRDMIPPSQREFHDLVKGLVSADKSYGASVLDASKRIVATGKTVRDEERLAIEYMARHFQG